VYHLDKQHQDLRPNKRAELTQSLLEGDFDQAQLILKTKWSITGITRTVGAFFSPANRPSGVGESLKGQMTILSSGVSDPQFLCDIKKVENPNLLSMIQEVEELVHTLLAYSIDTTSQSMMHAVLEMQREQHRILIQREFEGEEKRLLNYALERFIQQINNMQPARQRDS
jgi:hypothetical protein